jgi:hypothetical protein
MPFGERGAGRPLDMGKIMTKKEACQVLLQISLDYGKKVSDVLVDAQDVLPLHDFIAVKRLVGIGLADVLTRVMTPIINEYPDLRPPEFDESD